MTVSGRRRPSGAPVAMFALAAWMWVANAAPPASTAREMAQLMEALGASGCEFQRNARWYDSGRAVEHLRRKQAWLLDRDLIDSTEQFIERAGTQSSMSGRAYQVRCPGGAAMPSAQWLTEELKRLRARTPPSR